jgi:hypothetical protein
MTSKAAKTVAVLTSLDQIPEFASEAEEADFWDTHSFSDELWDSLEPADDFLEGLAATGGKFGVSLEIDADTAERLRSLARRRKVSYLALIRQFIAERLYEEEKRDGISSTP